MAIDDLGRPLRYPGGVIDRQGLGYLPVLAGLVKAYLDDLEGRIRCPRGGRLKALEKRIGSLLTSFSQPILNQSVELGGLGEEPSPPLKTSPKSWLHF